MSAVAERGADSRFRAGRSVPLLTLRTPSTGLCWLIAALVGSLPFTVWPTIRANAPVGMSGLYALMADSIRSSGYALPSAIPWYGPGGIPFGYPPLALYLMALATGPLGIPLTTYLRWAPPAFFLTSLSVFFALACRLVGSPVKAALATIVAATAIDLAVLQTGSDGSVRSLALLFALGAMLAAHRGLASGNLGSLALGALLTGLTALTHLSYAFFLALSLVIFALGEDGRYGRVRRLAGVGVGALLVASPWIFAVFVMHGPKLLVDLALGMRVVSGPSQRSSVLGVLLLLLFPSGLPPIAYPLVLVSVVQRLIRRDWLLPSWMYLTRLAIDDSSRYADLLAALLVSSLLVDLIKGICSPGLRAKGLGLAGLVVALELMVSSVWSFSSWAATVSPAVTSTMSSAGTWLARHTPASATYLFLSESLTRPEWMPYLSSRTGVIGPWGAEWRSDFFRQNQRLFAVRDCVRAQSAACVDHLLDGADLHPDYLIVDQPDQYSRLIADLKDDPRWQLVPGASPVIAFARAPRGNPRTPTGS